MQKPAPSCAARSRDSIRRSSSPPRPSPRAARTRLRARWRRRAGAASGDRHDAARGVAGEPARAWARRSRHACGAAGARRAHSLGRHRLQGCAAERRCARLHRLREPARAGPHRRRGRSHRRSGALAANAACGAQDRAADAGLSRRRRPDGLRRRARRAGQHRRADRRSRRSGLPRDWRAANFAGAAGGGGSGRRRVSPFAGRLSPPARRASSRSRETHP